MLMCLVSSMFTSTSIFLLDCNIFTYYTKSHSFYAPFKTRSFSFVEISSSNPRFQKNSAMQKHLYDKTDPWCCFIESTIEKKNLLQNLVIMLFERWKWSKHFYIIQQSFTQQMSYYTLHTNRFSAKQLNCFKDLRPNI